MQNKTSEDTDLVTKPRLAKILTWFVLFECLSLFLLQWWFAGYWANHNFALIDVSSDSFPPFYLGILSIGFAIYWYRLSGSWQRAALAAVVSWLLSALIGTIVAYVMFFLPFISCWGSC